MRSGSDEFQSRGYFSSFKEYSASLRTWLIAYGIGGPAIVASQEHLWSGLSNETAARAGIIFLIGVAFQLLPTAVLKWALWELWIGVDDSARQAKRRWKFAKWASENYWIDLVTDFVSVALYAWATIIIGFGLL